MGGGPGMGPCGPKRIHPTEEHGIYDLNDNLISKFKNNAKLAQHLNISRVTVGKYLNSGLVYNKIYRFKINKE